MGSENSPTSVVVFPKCCECGCSCSTMNRSFSGTYFRSMKRKHDKFLPLNARMETENELTALRETVSSQQQTIQDLITELEEERNASSTAAEEAMSMILRLQSEKAEIQMESRQFKRFAEEKMAHDQQEMASMEELLYKREETIQSLSFEVDAYKHRLMSYGLGESEPDGFSKGTMSRNNSTAMENFEIPPYEIYPPLRCKINDFQGYPEDEGEEEKYAFGETPRSRDLENNNSPRNIEPVGAKNLYEKVTIVKSPRRHRHLRKFSADGGDLGTEFSPRFNTSFRKSKLSHFEAYPKLRKVENASEAGDDETSDRVYTVDSVREGFIATPRDSMNEADDDVRDLEIRKLYARLQSLEADRESMRRTIMSIGTDKAQLVLLKEIARNVCKDMSANKGAAATRKQSAVKSSALFRWIASFVFWRRKARRCRYIFGLSPNNVGLLMLLNRGTRIGGQWRRSSKTDNANNNINNINNNV